ncbi:MAG: TetR/AcrR family transcriptional regulator [Salinigranum sp.]
MSRTLPFFENPTTTREEIMRATFLALCEHGYADLTIDRIGEEFEKSKSLVYHHYDGKDDLLLDFLEYMLGRSEERIPFPEGPPDEHVARIVDRLFQPTLTEEFRGFARAMVELRAQAAHDAAYRELFSRSDEFVRKQIAQVVRAGVHRGVFRPVDPEATAALFQAVFVGVQTQRVTADGTPVADARAEFERYVETCLLADGE